MTKRKKQVSFFFLIVENYSGVAEKMSGEKKSGEKTFISFVTYNNIQRKKKKLTTEIDDSL